jgi:hypothetical protein
MIRVEVCSGPVVAIELAEVDTHATSHVAPLPSGAIVVLSEDRHGATL